MSPFDTGPQTVDERTGCGRTVDTFRGRRAGMTAATTAWDVVPAWMREPVTAEQYGAWTVEQCAGIEIMDGMVLVSPSPSKRHNRTARLLANALDTAAGTGVERRHRLRCPPD